MQEKTLEEFWQMLEDNRFIKSTNSITDEMTEIEGGIVDMEAVVKINGEFDKYDIEKWLKDVIEKAREEGRKEERQFILNVLDGIDIADKQMGVVGGTKAIRISLQNRII